MNKLFFVLSSGLFPEHLQSFISIIVWGGIICISLRIFADSLIYVRLIVRRVNSRELRWCAGTACKVFKLLLDVKYQTKKRPAYHMTQMVLMYPISAILFLAGSAILLSIPIELFWLDAATLATILAHFVLGTIFMLLAEWGKKIAHDEFRMFREVRKP